MRANSTKVCPHCATKHDSKQAAAVLSTGPPRPYDGHVAQVSIYRWLLDANGVPVDTGEIVYLDMASVKRVPVDLWPVQQTHAWIEERISRLQTPDLPAPLAKDADDAWQCRYCPVVEPCRQEPGR